MKKSIGLTANISEYRPNLPQTRHLNYFMGTNPVHMANGGDVRAGIPNYPDANVTRGFLPAALGFDNGGDAGQKKSWLDAIITVIADMVGGEETDEKVISTAKRIIDHHPEKAEQIIKQGIEQGKVDPGLAAALEEEDMVPPDVVPLVPSDRQPGLDTVTPIDTVTTGEPPRGAVDVSPDPTSPKMPDNIPVQSLPGPVGSGIIPPDTQFKPDTGISSITPDAQPPAGAVDVTGKPTNPLDLNGDGVVDLKDLGIAAKNGLWDIWKEIQKWLGFDGEEKPEEKPKIKEEKIIEGGPVDTVPSPVKPKTDEPIIQDGGITGIPPKGAVDVTGTPTLTKEQLKKGASIVSGEDPDKKKKDAPAWALPLMSAGFAMMASKSPYFLQALGEGGQKGLETYTGIEKAKEEKLDKESTRELQKAQAKYYMGEGRQPSAKTMVQNGIVGQIKNGVWEPIMDSTTKKPLRNTIGRAEAMEILSKNEMFNMASQEDKQKMITEYMDIYNNTNTFINDKIAEKEGGFNLGDAVGGWITDWLGLKSGGIVTLRR
tara:strand:+ start:57 stop:1685 length:1629 start_codon:yes stop_codon:yes gene_type:complete